MCHISNIKRWCLRYVSYFKHLLGHVTSGTTSYLNRDDVIGASKFAAKKRQYSAFSHLQLAAAAVAAPIAVTSALQLLTLPHLAESSTAVASAVQQSYTRHKAAAQRQLS